MTHLGLEERMVRLIMSCLRSVSYSILLNGQPVGNIRTSRGLRQGDPLSPYLFMMCAMGLQSLLQQVGVHGEISGVAEMVRGFPIYFLQMIVYYSVLQQKQNVKRS